MEQLGGTRQAELDAADMRRAVDQLALGLPLEGRAQRGAGGGRVAQINAQAAADARNSRTLCVSPLAST
jgi:hypothetical protein